jgi:FkbM family methyltransferase
MGESNSRDAGPYMEELIDTPKHNDLVYDVGMHKGEDTEFYLRKGFRVIAFEADPDLIHYCKDRLQQFIDEGRLIIVEGAIVDRQAADTAGKVIFYKNDSVSVWGTVCPAWAERNNQLGRSSRALEVNVVDFAGILRRTGIPHYMKIDIEGADMACVKALKQFEVRPNYISIESSKTSLASIKRELHCLVDLGYNSFQAVEQSSVPSTHTPPNPAREGNYVAHRFQYGSSGLFGSELSGKWKSYRQIVNQYWIVRLGYLLEGDGGIAHRWNVRGAWRFRSLLRRTLCSLTKAPVPGWYDTHARHSSVITGINTGVTKKTMTSEK